MRTIFTRARWITIGLVLGLIGVLYAQEPQILQRGIVIIRGNLDMGGAAGNRLCYEGATADAFETCLAGSDVTADVVLTLPLSGAADAAFILSTLTTNSVGIANSVWGVSNGLTFEGATANAGELFLTVADIATASRTMTLPDMGAASAVIASTLTTNTINVANSIWGISNALAFGGATGADGFEIQLTPADVGADRVVTIPDMAAASALWATTLTTNAPNVANSIWGISNAIAFGGATGADGFEIQLTPADVGADRVVTIPDMAAASALMASLLTTNAPQVANSVWGISNGLAFEGATGAADAFETTLTLTDPTTDNTVTLQNATGTVTLQTGATITLTNVDLDTTDNSVAANICETQASVTATGVAATDNLIWTMTSSDLGLGFSVAAIIPTGADAVSIRICNETAGALDPGAVADFRLVPIL